MREHTASPPQGKPTSYSRVTLSRIMSPVDVNLYGTVHGGVIMKFVDDTAGAAAARHTGGNALTAAIDEIAFLEPVRPETAEDARRFREAEIRRDHRPARRAAIHRSRTG